MEAARPGALVEAGAAPELSFRVEEAEPLKHAAVPTLRFALRIESAGAAVRSVMLDTQIQIAARRRSYDGDTEARLFELFGAPADWSTNLRNLLWTRTTLIVPPFQGSTVIDLPVTCTYDFDVTAAKYLASVRDGEIPLEFLFSGTFFYAGPTGALQTGRIGWDRDADYRLPVAVWRETMDIYFRDSSWLRLRRDTFDRLYAYKASRALTSWEAALDRLLADAEDQAEAE